MKKLLEIAAGLAGGLVGTVLIRKVAMPASSKLPERHQLRLHGDPADAVLEKAEELSGRQIPERVRERVKPALSYLYGLAGPVALAMVADRIGRGSVGRTLTAGAIMGAIVWAVGALWWLPSIGVAEPLHHQPLVGTASNLVGHAAYGLVAALPIALVERTT